MGRPELTAVVRRGDKAQAGLREWVHTESLAGLTLHPHFTHPPPTPNHLLPPRYTMSMGSSCWCSSS